MGQHFITQEVLPCGIITQLCCCRRRESAQKDCSRTFTPAPSEVPDSASQIVVMNIRCNNQRRAKIGGRGPSLLCLIGGSATKEVGIDSAKKYEALSGVKLDEVHL